jgi:repressor LexA
MEMAEIIKTLRLQRGWTQEELGAKVGLQKSAIAKYENGRVSNMKRPVIQKMAEVFGVDPSYLMGFDKEDDTLPPYDNIAPLTTHKLPVLGSIACGQPIFMEEQFEFYVEVGTEIKADYILRAKGDSMINARINNGDIIFIRNQPTVENGQIAAVAIGDSVTLKRVYYYPESQKLVLQAENPKYEPMVYVGQELEDVRILGRAMAFQSDII